jgi:DNA-binding transcriptional ArsR family regulator
VELATEEQERLLKTLKTLANQTRLKIIASLAKEPKHAYALAKELGVSYPLAHLHLKGLRKMGLVEEIREELKTEGLPTVKTYAPVEFKLTLTPEYIRDLFQEED